MTLRSWRWPRERQLHADETVDRDVPRLLAEQDRLGDVGREERQRKELPNIGFGLAGGGGDLLDGSGLPGLQRRPPSVCLSDRAYERAITAGADHPAGYIHLPRGSEAEWVKQLVAEQPVAVKTKRGFARLELQKLRERTKRWTAASTPRAAAWIAGADR